jgi:mannose-6-phosphate isomerase-like protein (cupin superfamily)
MKHKTDAYDKKIVKKPWGFEYTIFRNLNKLAITYVNILPKKQTSLHCHPSKKTGFIILSGKAKVQIGIDKTNTKIYEPSSFLVIRSGLFHSLRCISREPLIALEFETPADKRDLVRFKDLYGRQSKPYENLNKTQINNSIVFFKKPKKNKPYRYLFNNLEILIENYKDYKKMFKNSNNSISAIIDGKIINNKGKQVIGFGEIVRTQTLRKLSDKFKIHKNIILMKITKKNIVNRRKNTLIQIN